MDGRITKLRRIAVAQSRSSDIFSFFLSLSSPNGAAIFVAFGAATHSLTQRGGGGRQLTAPRFIAESTAAIVRVSLDVRQLCEAAVKSITCQELISELAPSCGAQQWVPGKMQYALQYFASEIQGHY